MIYHTNIRIIDKFNKSAGEWYCDPSDKAKLDYIKREFEEIKALEPDNAHKLETRGTHVSWHSFDLQNPQTVTTTNQIPS